MNGRPVLYYTLKAFEDSDVDEIIIVGGTGQEQYIRENIIEPYGLKKISSIITGGNERYESVRNGLASADSRYVLIHDGARCFISTDCINRMISSVRKYKAAIAAVPSKDTIKIDDQKGFVESTPDRNRLWVIQTPQCFEKSLIEEAYAKLDERLASDPGYASRITDDAMIVEASGLSKIHLTMGEYTNIKLTTPEDMVIGEAILSSKSDSQA